MGKTNKILLFAQLFILLGSLSLFYKVADQHDLENKKATAGVIFKSVNHELNDIIYQTKDILISWEESLETVKNTKDYCNSPIIKKVDNDPLYINYAVAELDGSVICSRLPLPNDYDFNKITPKFNEVKIERQFEITEFGLSKSTNEPRIALEYPLIDEQDKLKAVLFVTIRLRELSDRLSDLIVAKDSNLLISDENGTIEVVYPEDSSMIGKKVFSPTELSLILSKKEGQIKTNDEKGRHILYTFAPLTINENQDLVSFVIYSIERKNAIFNIPDTLTIAQLFMLSTSVILLLYISLTHKGARKPKKI